MNIGIFGGCFNPPHNMHYDIVRKLINSKYIDKCIIVPTGNNYNKKDLVDIDHRLKMLELILKDSNIEISGICKNNEYKYTYQQLDYFKTVYPNDTIYFICGTDNLDEFETWQKYKYILREYKLLVIRRDNDSIETLLHKYEMQKENIQIANIDKNPVSSTIIRNYIKKSEYEILEHYIDKNVIEYIKEKRLYKS